MSAILLDPHGDDCALFSAYLALRHRPLVAVCYRSQIQEDLYGIYASDREAETAEACEVLGVDFEQWETLDTDIHDTGLPGFIRDAALLYDNCFAPAHEPEGHHQHNRVAVLALEAFGPDRITSYMTYRRGSGRSTGYPNPPDYSWPAVKLRAMACFPSQINLPATQPWFTDGNWIHEWLA